LLQDDSAASSNILPKVDRERYRSSMDINSLSLRQVAETLAREEAWGPNHRLRGSVFLPEDHRSYWGGSDEIRFVF